MNLLFRTDASVQIGTGHVMRCLTLADALREKGVTVSFICRELEGNLSDLVDKQGFSVARIKPHMDEGQAVIEILQSSGVKPDWLVVDHYEYSRPGEQILKPYVHKLMVIDDLANRRHDCDLLLDQNFTDNLARYRDLVPRHCVSLVGTDYALLRKEFLTARKTIQARSGIVKNILIFMGGSDPSNETGKILDAIFRMNRPDLEINVVVGSSNPHIEILNKMIAGHANVSMAVQVSDMAQRMSKADLCIGAGGSATWERMCLGLPTLTIAIADNQVELTHKLADQNYTIFAGRSEQMTADDLKNLFVKILHDVDLIHNISRGGMHLVDGMGAARVAEAILLGTSRN